MATALAVAALSAPAAGSRSATFTAAVDDGARLGGASAITAHLAIDSRRHPSPVIRLHVRYPKGLDFLSSGLAAASCARPASEFVDVLVTFRGLGGCSPNAVLGYGTARAEVRLVDGQVIPEYAKLTLLAGPIEDGRIGLLAIVDGQHPFGARLVYRGDIGPPHGRYGGSFNIALPSIPSIRDLATVALIDLTLEIGSPAITYYRHPRRRAGPFHPAAPRLPSRCPRAGLPFRADLAFESGGRMRADARVRCQGL